MAVKAPKNVKEISNEAMRTRLNRMLEMKQEVIDNGIENYHVRLMDGNSKTGKKSKTVSLIPVVDCPNCSGCMKLCYDLRNDCWRDCVTRQRAINSAIHELDPDRYWREIEMGIQLEGVEFLRINVGGDMSDDDFVYVNDMARRQKQCTFLFFTKNYKGADQYLKSVVSHRFEENVSGMRSAWIGMPMDNPYDMPVAHVMFADGSTTAPMYGAILCRGNCTECYLEDDGCVGAKYGEHVVMNAH